MIILIYNANRNICQEYGFVNNARVVIIEFAKNSICVETIDNKRKRLSLPRIKFRFRVAYGQSYTMIRLQFPLKLGNKCIYFNDKVLSHNNNITHIAYAFTVHKVQGQTVQKLLFDARESVFSHGGLYVALSRVRKFSNIGFIVNSENVADDNSFIKLKNIVFQEVLKNQR